MPFNKSQNEALISTGVGISTTSQRYDGTDSLGKLFAGLGDTLSNTLNAYDTQKKTEIELDAYNAVEQDVASSTPTPEAVTNSVNSVSNLAAARDQGVMSEVEFRTKLAARSKAMRANLPAGYAPLVDRAISSALGTSTANDLRIARLQEIEANQSATDRAAAEAAKNRREFQEQNLEYMGSGTFKEAYRQATGDKNWMAGDDYDYGTAVTLVGEYQSWKADTANKKNILDLEAARGVNDQKKISKYARQMVNVQTTELMNSDPDLKALVDDIQNGGPVPDPAKVKLLADHLNKFKLKARTGFDQYMRTPEMANLDLDEVKKLRAEHEEYLTTLDNAYTNPTMGRLEAFQKATTLRNLVEESETKAKYPFLAELSKLQKLGVPEPIFADYYTNVRHVDGQKRVDKELDQILTAATLSGSIPAVEAMKLAGEEGSVQKGTEGTAGSLINNLAQAFISPVLDDDQKLVAARNFYSQENSAFIAGVKDKSDSNPRLDYFKKFTTPEVLRIVSKDPAVQDAHAEWVTTQFNALAAIPKNTLYDLKVSSEIAKLSFDAEKMQFVYDSQMYYPSPGSLMGTAEAIKARQAWKAVNTMNGYLQSAGPVWEAAGYDKQKVIEGLFADFNSIENKGNFFSQMGRSVYDYFAGEKEAEQEKEQKAEAKPVSYANKGKIRDKPVTPELETKLATAVTTVFGEGYTAEVFSGGQDHKGHGHKRTGSIRHDGGQAADVYILGPDGKRVTDTKTLEKLKKYWLENDMGSVGSYMKGAGLHLDEWTKEELYAGMASSWKY